MTRSGEPGLLAPAYGGYCAMNAALRVLLPVDISTWQVVNDRLVLNYSADVQKMFNQDLQGTLKKADAAWPKLVAEHGK